mmetsp:Transcript_7383/g.15745  ORF Transcript_7383/g.15745 Transcript_7383/m.15745 type:complete len:732 (+) Transcript_7383:143-2338(+)
MSQTPQPSSQTPRPQTPSLSPSDESRFVPRESMPSSVLREQYLALAADGSVESAAIKAEATKLVPSDVNGSGIVEESMVGATICFTPEPSPPNSPTASKRDKSYNHNNKIGNSYEGSNCYIGSITALSSKDESAGRDMVSSAHQIASSLDGKGTTEYQILDGISSKGTLEIEELLDEGSSGRSQSKKKCEAGALEAGALETGALDPDVTLPSINDNDSSPSDVSKLTIQTSFIDTEDAPKPPTNLDDGPAGSDTSDISPEVDETPLTPFTNLHKFWESKSSTISAIGRIFGVEKSNTDEGPPVPKDEAIAKAASLPGQESSGQVNESVQARSAIGSKSSQAALKEFFMSIPSLIASNLAVLCLLFHNSVTLLLRSKSKSSLLRLILDKISGFQGSIGSDHSSKYEEGCNFEENATKQAPFESTLFHGELSTQAASIGPDNATAALVGTSTDDLDAKEKDVLGRINQRFAASVSSYGDLILVGVTLVIAVAGLFFFTSIHRPPAFQADSSYREDLVCILSRDMSLVAVPYWEFNLLSSADSFAEAGIFDDKSMGADSNWLAVFASLSTAIAAGAALIFNGRLVESISRHMHKPSAEHQTGIWTTLEHKQFLEGYRKYGNNWKAVARLVPSRSHKQVASHGTYWLKVRSPTKMARSRKSPVLAKKGLFFGKPFMSTTSKNTPISATPLKTPAPRTILHESTHSLTNVTPRSAERIKQAKQIRRSPRVKFQTTP